MISLVMRGLNINIPLHTPLNKMVWPIGRTGLLLRWLGPLNKSPYNFWAEAISTACHASNRLYLRKKINKTPYEILTGNKPNISFFRVFGCKCFYLIKGVRLSKFESKALEGIFVGYGLESHTYRIYDKLSGVVIESCSVTFEEY